MVIDLSTINKEDLVFRDACEKDMKDVFDLSNDPVVRSVAFNQDEISWVNHQDWFLKKIADSSYTFYVTTWQEQLVAQIRFEKDSSEQVTISISLAKDFRGKGLAAYIISKASQMLFEADEKVMKIRALIRLDNPVSSRSFESASFKHQGDDVCHEVKVKSYFLDRL